MRDTRGRLSPCASVEGRPHEDSGKAAPKPSRTAVPETLTSQAQNCEQQCPLLKLPRPQGSISTALADYEFQRLWGPSPLLTPSLPVPEGTERWAQAFPQLRPGCPASPQTVPEVPSPLLLCQLGQRPLFPAVSDLGEWLPPSAHAHPVRQPGHPVPRRVSTQDRLRETPPPALRAVSEVDSKGGRPGFWVS